MPSGSSSFAKELYKVKKQELHIHLEGSVSPDTLKHLAGKHDIDLYAPTRLTDGSTHKPPNNTAAEIPTFENFSDFIGYYLKITDTMRDDEDIVYVADQYAKSAREQNIELSEIYFSPTTYDMYFDRDMDLLFEGLRRAEEHVETKYGIKFRWIFDIVRTSSSDGFETLELAKRAKKCGVNVSAIGLAGYEAKGPARLFANAFKEARTLGFETLAHAGETAGAESIAETIEFLKPSRIGHGLRVFEDLNLVRQLAESRTIVEVCPWSNVLLGLSSIAKHPLPRMLDEGINVTICSDDPGIFGKTLVENYLLAEKMGISQKELLDIAISDKLKHK